MNGDVRSHKLAVVWGTFDNLHNGHREFLERASSLGSLHVIVVPDDAVFENKGRPPLFSAEERASQLRALPCIAGVLIDSWQDGLESLRSLRPDYFCAGYDQEKEWEIRLLEFCKVNRLQVSFVRFGEYAGGLHSSQRRQ